MTDKIIPALCEGYDHLAEIYYGRSGADSPEVDGKLFFTSPVPVRAGDFVRVRVTAAENGDLFGECVN
jgi:ribosomal protein S12 methylthiotransferase